MLDYAISVWNFARENEPLVPIVDFFADAGFNAVSFKPEQVLRLERSAAESLKRQLETRSLGVTIHANFGLSTQEADALMVLFGGRLRCLTLDPRCRVDPDGAFFSRANMLPLLDYLRRRSEDTQLRFGLEDFPLDQQALEANRDALELILGCPRFGILVDLGHMHLRTSDSEYFRKKGEEKYLMDVPVPIIEVHVHDNNADGDRHMPPGSGSMDFGGAAATLRRIGFSGVSTIEITPRLYGALSDAERLKTGESLRFWRGKLEQE